MPDKMDGTTKFAAWIVAGIFFLIVVVLGLFGWAVIELVQWITSK